MTGLLETEIRAALAGNLAPGCTVEVIGADSLPSCFDVSELAVASLRAAAGEIGTLTGAATITLEQRLALKWFDMTVRPVGWSLPSIWDPVAGDYRTRDGWIRLHTNAPHHRAAALSALGCEGIREAVAATVLQRGKDELESAVVAAGGCAAAMRGLADWAAHPQGIAVAAEPLIAWERVPQDAAKFASPSGLSGLKVLDLTRVLAGPVATRFLAAYGADVLRIDPPSWNEPPVEAEVTLGKTCAGLDLHRAEDRVIFERLLAEADFLIHGYRPGALENLGYDAETRRRINPRHIEVTLCAYGWTGPWSGRRGFDSLVQMSSGIAAEGMARAGSETPKPLPVQALDHATGYLMAAAALRALRIRQATGEVLTARLSLARTAHLLTAAGAHAFTDALAPETEVDIAPAIEETSWGPARRVRFPLRADGAAPIWKRPAGAVRRDPPRW